MLKLNKVLVNWVGDVLLNRQINIISYCSFLMIEKLYDEYCNAMLCSGGCIVIIV